MATRKLTKLEKKKQLEEELGINQQQEKLNSKLKLDKGEKIKWILAAITFVCLWILFKLS